MKKNSLSYRKKRINKFLKNCGGWKKHDLFYIWKPPRNLIDNLKFSSSLLICKAMNLKFTSNEKKLIKSIDNKKSYRKNITPNGAIVPKLEYELEYNLFLKSFFDILSTLNSKKKNLITHVRLTPNLRIKFGKEIRENIGRPSDTANIHSDAWLEGPWGLNCHIPLFGDTSKNFLSFYEYKDEKKFNDNFLNVSPSYKEMKWVLPFYKKSKFIPKKNFLNISDYALLHKTCRKKNSGTRISIDTTFYVGNNFSIARERKFEYSNKIPEIGTKMFAKCHVSENEKINNNKSKLTHYTKDKVSYIDI